MKRLSILFAFALITAMPLVGVAADTAMNPLFKADLSGAKIPGMDTDARGQAVFMLSGERVRGAATGGVAGDVDTMSDVGTSVPGDNTGMSGPGQGFDQGGLGTAYEGIVNSDVNNTGSAAGGTDMGYWGMKDERYEEYAEVYDSDVSGAAAGGSTRSIKGDSLGYLLSVNDIRNVTAAHLHQGKPGSEGPVIAPLYIGAKRAGEFDGLLAEGTITARDLRGPLAGKTLDDLLTLIRNGDVYVNVHTDQHPAGEISGVLERAS